MTTRAGVTGLAAGGLLLAVLFYPLYVVWPGAYVAGWLVGPWPTGWAWGVAVAGLVACGGLAAWWGGARRLARRVALGALAGGLAGLIVFCGIGAAAAGVAGVGPFLAPPRGLPWLPWEPVVEVISWTNWIFWELVVMGAGFGGVGGLLVSSPSVALRDEFDLREPQMALNTAITAVPASAVAVILAAAFFAPLASGLEHDAIAKALHRSPASDITWQMITALLVYLLSLTALALVTPHEARQATHRPGLDEVKMAAWVGIFVPPVLAVWLAITHWRLALSPLVGSCLLVSLGLSAYLVVALFKLILPKRAQMPPPERPVEAVFFGSIANSQGPRLVVLCIGCGLVMMAPLYVSVGAAALSLALMPTPASAALTLTPVQLTQRLYQVQAAVGLGLMAGAALVLSAIYLFYLWLGRTFSRATRR